MEAEQASAVREPRQNLGVTLSISPSEVNPRNEVAAISLDQFSKRNRFKTWRPSWSQSKRQELCTSSQRKGDQMGRNLMGPPLSWRPPDVADAMSEQPQLQSILFSRMLKPVLRITDQNGSYLLLSLWPGLPGPVPGPSLTLGFPGGCGSSPLPTPLFPFSLRSEPFDANDGTAFNVRITGAMYAAFFKSSRFEICSSVMVCRLLWSDIMHVCLQ